MTKQCATYLEDWFKNRAGIPLAAPLKRADIEDHQLKQLNETLMYASHHSPFYKNRLNPDQMNLKSLADHSRLPFTTEEDLRHNSLQILSTSQNDVSRVVTLQTSGTTHDPKRLYFTEQDLAGTLVFFHHVMSHLFMSGQRMLILLPGSTPDSLGDLLSRALKMMGARGIIHGLPENPQAALEAAIRYKTELVIGLPTDVLSMARHSDSLQKFKGLIKKVVLCSDYIPDTLVNTIKQLWHCEVFEHYGMTEMGYGGGIQCSVHEGYHLREADLFFEIVDPETGHTLTNGESGEVVFTTLTQRGMPLIRYRTGDISRLIPEPCPCGSIFQRLDKVMGRINGALKIGINQFIFISDLDEIIFRISGIQNYEATIERDNGHDCLILSVYTDAYSPADITTRVKNAVLEIPAIHKAISAKLLQLKTVALSAVARQTQQPAKRKIIERYGNGELQ
ncbi:MAG: AMP-binding protein [Desulfobacterales bacterium]|nr:AMP-binding protein [Desulfobacterales bacterium]